VGQGGAVRRNVVGVVAVVVGGVALFGGCSVSKTLSAGTEPDAMDGVPPDDMETTGVAACKTPDPTGLVVCFEFEDSVADGVLDDSSPARRDAMTSGVSQLADPSRGMAIDIQTMANTYVTGASPFDLPNAYTLTAWVKPDTAMPPSTARGVLDHEGQYAMITSATPSGAIHNRCQHTGVQRYEYTTRLPVGQWSFLACTWDGNELCAYRWASPTDRERYCHTPTFAPAAVGTRGLAVGHLSYNGQPLGRFDGALDSVQVYSRRLTSAQICALLGQDETCLP
jgi:hypothetical protein